MVKTVTKTSPLIGEIEVPSDKSITHRTILLSALANGTSTIKNPLEAEDCLSTAQCIEQLGVKIQKTPGQWTVESGGLWSFQPPKEDLNCGNSGTTMRLLSGILSAQPFSTTLTGDASLSKRPMKRVAEPLSKMGAQFQLREEMYAPFTIKGTKSLTPLKWKSSVASAQVKSAVLLAGLHTQGTTEWEEPLTSRDHTEQMLRSSGVDVKSDDNCISITGPTSLKPMNWVVPGDFSSAAFFIVAGLLIDGSRIKMKSVNINPTRTGLLPALQMMGAKITIENRSVVGGESVADVIVEGRMDLRALNLEPRLVPHLIDEIPILAIAATQARGKSVFSGLSELRVKETDRIAVVVKNLIAMGVRAEERPDGFVIYGPAQLKGGDIDSHHDHRIAMAFGIAGLLSDGPTQIRGSEAVSISFPSFWDILDALSPSK